MTGRRLRAAPVSAVAAVLALANAGCYVLAAAPPAHARAASGAEVSDLARRALAGDRAALADLREVDRVDGRPYALKDALGVKRRSGRLRALAEGRARRQPDTAVARREARRLLAERRFHEPSIPRPLRGVFDWIGTGIAPLIEAAQDAVDSIASLVPGGRRVGLTVLAGAALLLFAVLASRTLRLRSRRRSVALEHESARVGGPSPADLKRAAADAERSGDLSLAVRLRFRAGLLELERQGTISLRASLTTAAIGSRLSSREFTTVAASFEEVAYGGRTADSADVETQRTGWPRVLEEVR